MTTKYQSTMGGGEITAAQFVMEQFLLLLARQDKTTLPTHFWKLPKYQQLWKRHVRSVHSMLKTYDANVISKAFRDKKLKNLRALSKKSSWLWKPVFDKYQKAYEQELKTENSDVTADVDPLKRRIVDNKSSLQNLRDLDNA